MKIKLQKILSLLKKHNKDTFKGKVGQVVEEMKKELINQLNEIEFGSNNLEFNSIENIQDNIKLYLDCINGIYQDYITNTLNKNDEIEVYYNPMGNLYYKIKNDETMKDVLNDIFDIISKINKQQEKYFIEDLDYVKLDLEQAINNQEDRKSCKKRWY